MFSTYHDAPVKWCSSSSSHQVSKYGVMACVASSKSKDRLRDNQKGRRTRPIVAYVSSAKSGNTGKNAGLMPEAFHELLNGLLNAPARVHQQARLVVAKHRTHAVGWISHVHIKTISRQTGRDGGRRLNSQGVWADAIWLAINVLQQSAAERKVRKQFMLEILTV